MQKAEVEGLRLVVRNARHALKSPPNRRFNCHETVINFILNSIIINFVKNPVLSVS